MASLEPLLREATLLSARWQEVRDEIARRCQQTRAAWQVLAAAGDGSHTVPELGRKLHQSRQGVQRVADRLVENGLAAYHRNPHHRRSPLLKLSERGQSILRDLEREAARREPDLEAELEPEDVETAIHVLRAVRDLL